MKALDVGLVDDGLVPVHIVPCGLGLPIEIGIDHHAFRHEGRAVALIEGEVVAALHLVAEHGRIPCQRAGMGARIGIEQQLVGVEAMAGVGLIGAIDAVAIEGAGADPGDIAVKHLIGIFRQFEAVRLTLAVEQADLHLGGIGRKHGKVGAFAAPMRAQRPGQAFLDHEIGH